MKRLVVSALGLFALATAVLAADPPPPKIFPDDYTPNPCAPKNSCDTFERSGMRSAAFNFLGLQLDRDWLEKHGDEMVKAFEPVCRKLATCLATPGNNFLFCDDVISTEMRDVCGARFPKEKGATDWQQCETFMETFELGVDQKSEATWLVVSECGKEKTPAVDKTKPLIYWVVPPLIPAGFKDYISIHGIDPDTHVPMQADITIEGQIVYTWTNPAGNLQTYYPFKWPTKFNRVKNAATGHTDIVPPTVTIKKEHYPTITFPMPVQVPQVKLELMPPPAQLHPGKNVITVFAKDATSGKPAELRVMFGDAAAGSTNEPIELMIDRKTKRPEIWVTSLFDWYSDQTVVPAEK
jgi:hypothetical protein